MKQTLWFISRHPFNQHREFKALLSFFRWQCKIRLLKGPFKHQFTNKASLLMEKGMSGATGNIYCGLHEFQEMAFLLHYLRPGELFGDIGANVGSYSVLASAHIGARVIAAEPIPSSMTALRNNVLFNGVENLVDFQEAAVGEQAGQLQLTNQLGAMNHVTAGADDRPVTRVPVITLDQLFGNDIPVLLKIDVEGYESAVIKGAPQTLQQPGLQAIIMELNGAGYKYGFDEEQLHRSILEAGFLPYTYDPYTREIIALQNHGHHNTIYLRDLQDAIQRVKSAEAFTVQGKTL